MPSVSLPRAPAATSRAAVPGWTVALLDDVAEMNPYPKLDTAVLWQAGVTLDHAVLHFDRATHGVHHAAELDEGAVTGSLYDPPLIGGDGGIDEIAAQPSKTGKGANLVGPGEPAVSDNIRD